MYDEFEYYSEDELIKYYAKQISQYCKAHRCATCPFYIGDKCTFLSDSPDQWKGIDDTKGGAE